MNEAGIHHGDPYLGAGMQSMGAKANVGESLSDSPYEHLRLQRASRHDADSAVERSGATHALGCFLSPSPPPPPLGQFYARRAHDLAYVGVT